MKLSLRKKIIFSMTSLTLIPLVLICIFVGMNIYKTNLKSFSDAGIREMAQIETAFDFFFTDLKENIDFFVSDPLIKELKGNMTSYLNTKSSINIPPESAGEKAFQIWDTMKRFLDTHTAYVEVFAGSSEGEVLLATNGKLPAGYDPRVRPWYKDAVKAGKTTITEPYLSTSKEITISIIAPIFKNNVVQGAGGVDVSPMYSCLLYTSDAADDTPCVDLGGLRIIKKKKKYKQIASINL
eukprot:TRINITY_DN31532_c0_g1_i1.p1 TRINITY_DN31532_c0_g1~~TRINITY_DN31532_c0_g1_i1.p1  ORF type:complete len:239 (+),score=49.33 TRINITY_DN31532_c0_g1_i1:149-865(+)